MFPVASTWMLFFSFFLTFCFYNIEIEESEEFKYFVLEFTVEVFLKIKNLKNKSRLSCMFLILEHFKNEIFGL